MSESIVYLCKRCDKLFTAIGEGTQKTACPDCGEEAACLRTEAWWRDQGYEERAQVIRNYAPETHITRDEAMQVPCRNADVQQEASSSSNDPTIALVIGLFAIVTGAICWGCIVGYLAGGLLIYRSTRDVLMTLGWLLPVGVLVIHLAALNWTVNEVAAQGRTKAPKRALYLLGFIFTPIFLLVYSAGLARSDDGK